MTIEVTGCNVRVIFVGMHNKPGMDPLDSKTKSGKLIDRIIKELPFESIKTNLFDGDYLPTDFLEINNAGIEWLEKYKPDENSIVILLGNWVREHFWHDGFNIIHIHHPASFFGNRSQDAYVIGTVRKIIGTSKTLPSCPLKQETITIKLKEDEKAKSNKEL